MHDFRDVLLEVWREACRHIDISESVSTLAKLLSRHLPLGGLLIRRFESPNCTVATVAVGQTGGTPLDAGVRNMVTPARWEAILAWAERGEVTHSPAKRRVGCIAQLAPPELDNEVMAGPLQGPEGPAGALLVWADPARAFVKSQEQMLSALLEPFSVALENDRRLHELAHLREAAEAERRSLLSKFGGQDFNEQVVGAETGLRHVMERVELVAQSDVPVLILGETGTGKEVVSRAIHARSPRANAAFIRVNCGAIPPELLDSQLFGHEKGSFTGASDTRQGWFERADGGTLFLDEIGELPLQAQVRLLRVLQDGYIERVGGQRSIRVDVRIVAATHRDLAGMVKVGTFREDLWYRVNVFPIILPRLRERVEDIPALARHFAKRAANRFGLPEVEPSLSDLQSLLDYSWPGNIRELGAVIDRATILGEGRRLEVAKALGFSRQILPVSTSNEPTFYEVIPEATHPLINHAVDSAMVDSLDTAMKRHIERALVASKGIIEGKRGAAALLAVNPHTLRARMRKLGVSWNSFRPM